MAIQIEEGQRAVGAADQAVWRVTGYFVGDPVAVDHVAARVYRDDVKNTVIVSSLVVADSRDEAVIRAGKLGWLSPIVERFRAGAS